MGEMSLPAAPIRRAFPWLPLLVLLGVAGMFVAVTAEIILRLAELRASNVLDLRCTGAATVLQRQKGLFQLDPDAGYVMRPNVCVRLRYVEFDDVVRTNSRGLVGPELPASKPADEFRIVVLGDSYAVGGQVPYEQTFPAVLEQELHARGYAHARVVNASVGGYSTFNEAGLLRANLSWLQPDLVVVAVFVGNDVAENVLATYGGYRDAPEHPDGVTWGWAAADLLQQSFGWFPRNGDPSPHDPETYDPAAPLPTPVGNTMGSGRAREPAAARSPSIFGQVRSTGRALWDRARSSSRVLGSLFGDPIASAGVTTAPGAAPPSKTQRKLNVSSFEWTILRDVPHEYWLDAAWPMFGKYVAEIRDSAASVGAPVVLVAIPQMGQFDEAMRSRIMADYRFTDDEVDWDRPQRDLRTQADRAGVPTLDLLPVFRARPERTDLYLRLDTHFSALGHEVTAEQLADFLATGGWLN
jgi:lysophospholipase L1-like esterase